MSRPFFPLFQSSSPNHSHIVVSWQDCDPHPANVLLREHPEKKGKPQLVLVDHGLYKMLDRDFQEAYARLWRGIVMANIPEIQSSCGKLGVHKMVRLI